MKNIYMPDTCKIQLATSSFIFCFFKKSAFVWVDLIFYNFLEPHSAFSAKNIEYTKKKKENHHRFSCLINSSKHPPAP